MKKKPPVDLLFDSGAYSAWNRKEEPLELKGYIKYVKDHQHLLGTYVNMDVIPAERTLLCIEAAAEAGYTNLKRMKKAGLEPLPVFHINENFSWLQCMIDDGETYIGLGGMAKVKQAERRKWLDAVFSMLTDAEGRPLIKLHGFGITQTELLKRYPWYSVDSTAWTLAGGYGIIYVPWFDGVDHFDFTKKHTPVMMSGGNRRPDGPGRQFEALGEMERVAVEAWLFLIGTTVTEARNQPDLRRRAMLLFFEGLRKQLHDVRFWQRSHPIGIGPFNLPKGMSCMAPWDLKMVYATNLSSRWAVMMNEAGADHRLLSYYEMKGRKDPMLEEFVMKRGVYGIDKAPFRPAPNWKEPHLNFRRMQLANRSTRTEAME